MSWFIFRGFRQVASHPSVRYLVKPDIHLDSLVCPLSLQHRCERRRGFVYSEVQKSLLQNILLRQDPERHSRKNIPGFGLIVLVKPAISRDLALVRSASRGEEIKGERERHTLKKKTIIIKFKKTRDATSLPRGT